MYLVLAFTFKPTFTQNLVIKITRLKEKFEDVSFRGYLLLKEIFNCYYNIRVLKKYRSLHVNFAFDVKKCHLSKYYCKRVKVQSLLDK